MSGQSDREVSGDREVNVNREVNDAYEASVDRVNAIYEELIERSRAAFDEANAAIRKACDDFKAATPGDVLKHQKAEEEVYRAIVKNADDWHKHILVCLCNKRTELMALEKKRD